MQANQLRLWFASGERRRMPDGSLQYRRSITRPRRWPLWATFAAWCAGGVLLMGVHETHASAWIGAPFFGGLYVEQWYRRKD